MLAKRKTVRALSPDDDVAVLLPVALELHPEVWVVLWRWRPTPETAKLPQGRDEKRLSLYQILWFFTGLPSLKNAVARGHLAAGARFGACRRAGAAEEVRFGVRRAPAGAQTPENSGESTGKLLDAMSESIRGKV